MKRSRDDIRVGDVVRLRIGMQKYIVTEIVDGRATCHDGSSVWFDKWPIACMSRTWLDWLTRS